MLYTVLDLLKELFILLYISSSFGFVIKRIILRTILLTNRGYYLDIINHIRGCAPRIIWESTGLSAAVGNCVFMSDLSGIEWDTTLPMKNSYNIQNNNYNIIQNTQYRFIHHSSIASWNSSPSADSGMLASRASKLDGEYFRSISGRRTRSHSQCLKFERNRAA